MNGKGELSDSDSGDFGMAARGPDGLLIPNPKYHEQARPFLQVHTVDGVEGAFWQHASADEIVRNVARVARQWGIEHVHADQRESLALESMFNRHALRYHVHDWTAPKKIQAVERLRRLLADDALFLPPHEKLKRELLSFEEKITPAGSFTFSARGTGHDDYVSLLITGCIAELEGGLHSSPFRKDRRRFETQY